MIKFLREIAGALIVAAAILFTWAYQNACWAGELEELSLKADAVLLKGGLACTVTDIQIRPAEEVTFNKVGGGTVQLAAFFGLDGPDAKTARKIIRINQQWWDAVSVKTRLHVLVHEKIHCARYETIELAGGRQPRSMDPREEMITEMQTQALLQDGRD